MNKLKKIIPLSLIVCCQASIAYNKTVSEPSYSEVQDSIAFQVGSKTIKTVKKTNDGAPVVPMWNTRLATDDLRSGAGFPILKEAEHARVWQPSTREEGAYNHYACLIHHKGKFYAMWGNHELGEDAPGQRVLYATSDTWGQWTDVAELYPALGRVV